MRRTGWMLLVLGLVLGLAAGCGDDDGPAAGSGAREAGTTGDAATKPATWPSAEARRLAPDKHPTPYTAEQIRRGCKDGRTIVYVIENRGQEAIQQWSFDKGDAQGVTWAVTPLAPDKEPAGPPQSKRMEWAFLQSHGSHPAAKTHVTEATIEGPAGRFACMVYAVEGTRDMVRRTQDEEETVARKSLTKYWFAWALPGPPVRMEERIEGELVTSMVMVENGYERGP